VGHYGGSYKVTYDLYKKFGETRLLDTPICGKAPAAAMLVNARASQT
jgi:pyruvate dehydrogenase E1 component beta subunit